MVAEYNKQKGINLRHVLVDDAFCYLFFIAAIINGLAVSHSDTSLAPSIIPRLLAATNILLVLIIAMLVFIKYKFNRLNIAIFVPIIYAVIYAIDSYNDSPLNIYMIILMLLFILMKDNIKAKVFHLYRNYIFLMSSIGIFFWVCYVLSLPIPYAKTSFYANILNDYYINYGITYLNVDLVMVRLCGLFNEPGYFGTILALVLCADKLNFKDKKNIVIFIAGCLSFSAAFIAILMIYVILLCYKKPKLMFPLTILLLVYLFVLPNITLPNPALDSFVKRFVFTAHGFAGDNRSDAYQDLFVKEMLQSSNAVWGMGTGFSQSQYSGVLTYKTYLINYGIAGFALMYGSLLFSAIKECSRNPSSIIFTIVFFVSVYQRPSIFNILYFVILFGGIQSGNASTTQEYQKLFGRGKR